MPTNAERSAYLDSSAIVKLVVDEPESAALRRALETTPIRASSGIARVEVVRAVRTKGRDVVESARVVLESIDLVVLDDELLDLAADLEGPLRSLDAIHLAAALELGDELEAVVTYDGQLTRAAELLGLPVVAPA